MERLIFHVDVNSAFLSWEAAKRVKMGLPDLRDIPSCIGGDPSKRTGIVVAKSIPAKKYESRQESLWLWLFANVRILWPFHLTLNYTINVPEPSKKSVGPMHR